MTDASIISVAQHGKLAANAHFWHYNSRYIEEEVFLLQYSRFHLRKEIKQQWKNV